MRRGEMHRDVNLGFKASWERCSSNHLCMGKLSTSNKSVVIHKNKGLHVGKGDSLYPVFLFFRHISMLKSAGSFIYFVKESNRNKERLSF